MSGAQGKVKLIRNQQSSSRVNSKGSAKSQDYPHKTTAARSLKQPRRNLAEKRLLSLRHKLKESPPEVVSSTKEQKRPVKLGGKRKPSEDDVVDKAKKVKPNLECDRQKESPLNVQQRLEQLKHLMGSPLKKDTQKIPKIKKLKCTVEDHTDDETIIDYSPPANREEAKSVK